MRKKTCSAATHSVTQTQDIAFIRPKNTSQQRLLAPNQIK
jgi:hypothetical protein